MSKVTRIVREFAARYPRHASLLLLVLLLEGVVSMGAVLALVPFADYLLDYRLSHPSRITVFFTSVLTGMGIRVGFGSLGMSFVGANLLKGGFDVATRYSILKIKYAVTRGLFADALTTFFKARWEFFSGTDQGRLLNTLNRELDTIGDTLGHLATQLAQGLQLAVYVAVPFWVNPRMTLTALGLSLLFGSPLLLLHKVAYRLGRRNTESANVMMGVLSEVLSAARIILGFGRQRQAGERFLSAFDEHVHATLRAQTLAAVASGIVQPLGMLAAVIALGLALREGTPASEMAAMLFSLLRAFPLMSALMSTNVTISSFLPAYEQLVALRERAVALEERGGSRMFTSLRAGVELRNVDFTYPGRAETLRQISLTIRRGETTALVGESGSGKSTISDLVLGLQIPESGDVLLDGVPLADWSQNSFRERVGYVPQDPLLFHASIRENLVWAVGHAGDGELWEACRTANAESFIRALPQGLDTIVGDRGLRLSGGQRQRIALARALLRKPELLILDEATSSLDSESERLIQQAIDGLTGATTLLVIAHRLSTISRADRVYVLDAGRVIEEGAYAELVRRPGGVLASMIAIQRSVQPHATSHS